MLARQYRRPFIHTCHAGLTEVVVPVLYHNEVCALIFCGQCRVRGETRPVQVYRRLKALGADRERVEALLAGLPIVDRPQLLAAATLLDMAVRHIVEVKGRAALEEYANRRHDDHVMEAVRYIERVYQEDVSARDVAAAVHLSQAYLTRLFQRAFGHGITEHITRVRLEQARVLLAETTVPIHSIALNVGYPDANYFTRRFRQIVGHSPSAYRAACQSEPSSTPSTDSLRR